MTKIYESPDGGKTVYSREFGEQERIQESINNEVVEAIDYIRNELLWDNIYHEAKTNVALQNALDQVILIYKLSREYK